MCRPLGRPSRRGRRTEPLGWTVRPPAAVPVTSARNRRPSRSTLTMSPSWIPSRRTPSSVGNGVALMYSTSTSIGDLGELIARHPSHAPSRSRTAPPVTQPTAAQCAEGRSRTVSTRFRVRAILAAESAPTHGSRTRRASRSRPLLPLRRCSGARAHRRHSDRAVRQGVDHGSNGQPQTCSPR